MRRTYWLVGLLVLVVALVAGCGGDTMAIPMITPVVVEEEVSTVSQEGYLMAAPEENPKRGGILKTAWTTNPTHFDIHQGGGTTGAQMLYDGLVMYNLVDGYRSIIPALAASWTVSDDGTVYTFKLREGVSFHDGAPFNADDVIANFDRILNPPENVSIGWMKDDLSIVESVIAEDDMTIVFTLNQAAPYFLELLANEEMVLYSNETLEANDYDLRGVTVPPGTGPFKFVDYIQGEKFIMEANEDYWNPNLPYVDGIELLNVGAWADRGTAVLTGQADFSWNVSVDTWLEGATRDDLGTAQAFCIGSHVMSINNEHEPLNDPRVRRAINLAVDRQAVIDAFTPVWEPAFVSRWMPIASPYATPVDEMMTMPGYRPEKEEDIEEARRLMAEAGYPDGFETTFTAWTTAASSEVAVPAFAEQLRTSLNIVGDINVIERARNADVLRSGEYDLFKSDTYATRVMDPYPMWNTYFRTGATQNFLRYSNPEFDALLDELVAEIDPDARQELINTGMDMLDENPPMFLIGFCAHSPMWHNYVKGLNIPDRMFSKWGRFETVWLDQ